jgi:hypothetical protein
VSAILLLGDLQFGESNKRDVLAFRNGEVLEKGSSSNSSIEMYAANILYIIFMYYLKNEQECFIRFKATSAQREWL